MYPISEQLLTFNRSHEPLSPIGYVIHSTDNLHDTAQGERNYFNNNDLQASVHYFVGTEIIRCVPENEVAWGCGPTGNHKYLQAEMCEGEPFAEVWTRTVWLVADSCNRYGWTTGPDVWSHRGISAKYGETTHTDPIAYLQRNGKTWEELLSAIDAEIIALKTPDPSSPITIIDSPPTHIPAPVQSSSFSYPNNARVIKSNLDIRDSNGTKIVGRYVAIGDNITVLDVSGSKQLVLVEYPTPSGIKSGYVLNVVSCIQYYNQDKWLNGSTTETVYDENGGVLGSLDPREYATPLYRKNGKLHVVYATSKGVNTKSGYVVWDGGFSKF
jgi:hypothetical protein